VKKSLDVKLVSEEHNDCIQW